MATILLITSSPRGAASHSTRIATDLAERLAGNTPHSAIVHRDLVQNPLPHIGSDFAIGSRIPSEDRTPQQKDSLEISDLAIEELLSADIIIVATGMINFTVSSTLKSWIDYVAIAGRTFRYSEAGPEGLVLGKKAYLVLASGDIYSKGDAEEQDHAIPYLKDVLSFMGITDIHVIRVEGIAYGSEAEREAIQAAEKAVHDLSAA